MRLVYRWLVPAFCMLLGATADEVTLSPNPLVFAPGQTTQTLTITALSDADVGTESLILALDEPTATDPTTVTVPIMSGVHPISDAPIARTPDHPDQALATTQDGSTVVYSEQTADGAALVQYDIATSTKTLLYDGETRTNIAPVFTPDEQSVFFVTPTEVRRAMLDGTATPIVIPTEGCRPAIHVGPTNAYALVRLVCGGLNLQDRLLRVDLATNAVTTLATAPLGVRVDFAKITNDGRVVYIFRDDVQGQVYQQPLAEGVPQLLGTIALDGRFTELSLDGTVLFYKIDTTIYRWQLGAAESQILATTANGHIALTPHGDYVLYTYIHTECDRGGCSEVHDSYSVTANGNVTQRLECPQGGEEDWRFSPDGNTAVYGHSDGIFCILPLDGRGSAIWNQINSNPLAIGNFYVYAVATHPTVPNEELLAIAIDDGTPEQLFTDSALYPHTATGGDVLFFSDAAGYLYASTPAAPPVSYTAGGTLHAEGDSVEVTVTLASTPLETVTVDYALTGGTATEGEDFTFTPGTLTFAPFERTKTFTVEVLDDGIAESPETAVFTLSNITGGSAGEQTTYTLRIADEIYEQRLPLLQR